ncbi:MULTISPECIES: TlpA family protein disulfide reductase [Achromobacter]|uniref:TlpA disulfide reductase family protein n=1 Tax=Achromobacter spanius TaxID=217203 RepID=A0ABY8GXA4_9BURK|nr:MULTISPECIES: TlpA disulfide reductase family protein [Achromobacter]WAI81627.1 TlpA family protein disulfide reductase [Achromobacter spanius]WEX97146.1 TlpA family protein disulfide reductase [Achromobacter sp. SS2-2022]WFP09139.1 TlpA disulfide reductase family protein [Achromobacter spanius]
MSPAIRIGPLVFPTELAILIAAALVGLLAARLFNRQREDAARLSTVLWRTLVIGLLAARIAFVWQYRDHYLPDPIKMLDLRDGGWVGLAGLAAAWVYAIAAVIRHRAPRVALLGALALASVAWLGGGRWLAASPQPQPELAALAVQNVDGAPAALSAFQGKPTVINLWASWCPPCRREMPAFAAAQAANPDVNFVFLNQAEAPRDVTKFLDEHAPGLQNVLIDPAGEASRKFSNRGLPATLFLDAQGRLVDLRVGELSTASLAQRLESIRAAE